MKYPIKVQARINMGQYDKIKASGVNFSEYIREAIDLFDCDETKKVEESKIELLDELKKSIIVEDTHVNNFLKEQKIQNENIKKAIDNEYQNCNERLKYIKEQEKEYELLNIKKPCKRSREDIINEILPTLQGFKHSEEGITHTNLKRICEDVDISPTILMDWIKENKDLVEKYDFKNRPAIKYKGATREMDDKNK